MSSPVFVLIIIQNIRRLYRVNHEPGNLKRLRVHYEQICSLFCITKTPCPNVLFGVKNIHLLMQMPCYIEG